MHHRVRSIFQYTNTGLVIALLSTQICQLDPANAIDVTDDQACKCEYRDAEARTNLAYVVSTTSVRLGASTRHVGVIELAQPR